MSHLIDTTNSRNNIAYVAAHGKPWHGLGQALDENTDLDTWKREAGLGWTALSNPVQYLPSNLDNDATSTLRTVKNRVVLYRSDTGEDLSIQSENRFKIVQPSDVIEFYRDLVESSGAFTLETAGSLKGGRIIWALARSNMEIHIGDEDVSVPYVLLATAYDGTMSTVADFTAVRVVCWNTLSFAVGPNGKGAKIQIPHSRDFDADFVKRQLGLVEGESERVAAEWDSLASLQVSDAWSEGYFSKLYGLDEKQFQALMAKPVTARESNVRTDRSKDFVTRLTEWGTVHLSTYQQNQVNTLQGLYKEGPGADLSTAQGTVWGALNAVTNYQDHSARGGAERRFLSNQFNGHGHSLKSNAYNLALSTIDQGAYDKAVRSDDGEAFSTLLSN